MSMIDNMYERFVNALHDEGIDAEYDPRQGIVTLRRHAGFFRDLYESHGEFLVTYVASDNDVPREPSPPGSGMLSGNDMEELAAESADYIKNMSEQLEPLRSKIREIVKEDLDIKSGRLGSPSLSVNGYIQKFLRDTINQFAKELKGAYDIEFEDSVETRLSVQTDYEFYNKRQDIFYEGKILIYEANGEIHIEARGGRLGEMGDTFLNKSIGFSEDPTQKVDIVSAFKTLR